MLGLSWESMLLEVVLLQHVNNPLTYIQHDHTVRAVPHLAFFLL